MKKIISILGLFLLVTLTVMSCKRDENEDSGMGIRGSWQLAEERVTGTAISGQFTVVNVPTECQQRSRRVFQDNNKGVDIVWSEANGTCSQGAPAYFDFNYDSGAQTLTFIRGTSVENASVTILNDSNLQYNMVSTYNYNGVNYPVNILYVYKRSY